MTTRDTNGFLLDVNNIEVVYNDIIQVLRGVSLNVPRGGIVALLGTNGAGKTTTLRAISGLLKPENGFIRDGYIKFGGKDITNQLGTMVVKEGAVMVPEGRRVFKHLTVDENIRVGSITRREGATDVRRDQKLMYQHFPRLSRVTNRLAGYCSGGEQQMIAIARALMASPKMLMLDEPSLGLAPLLVKEIFENIQRINQEMDTTILLVEQNAKMALEVSKNRSGRPFRRIEKQSGCEGILHGRYQRRAPQIFQRCKILQTAQTLDVKATAAEGGGC